MDQTNNSQPQVAPDEVPALEPMPTGVPVEPNVEPPKKNWIIIIIVVIFIVAAVAYFVSKFFIPNQNVNLGGDAPLTTASPTLSFSVVPSPRPTFATSSSTPSVSVSTAPTSSNNTGAPLSLEALKNASYNIDGNTFVLANGFYNNQSATAPLTAKLDESFVSYNNPDPSLATRAATVVSTRQGSVATNYYVVILELQAGQIQELDAQLIDDRPIIQSISLSGDSVTVQATIHADSDQACCPTQKSTLVYTLMDGLLILQD